MEKTYSSYRELDRDIRGGNIFPVYFFYGENEYLIKTYERRIEDVVMGSDKGADDFRSFVFYAGDDAVVDVINTVMTVPMFGEKKCVLFRGAEKLKEKEVAALASYAAKPSNTSVLVITARGAGGGKKGGFSPPPGKLHQLLKCTTVCEFGAAREGDVRQWLKKKFTEAEKKVDDEVITVLVDFIGTDLYTLSGIVERILLYLGDENQITVQEVEALIPYLRIHSVFELSDALSRKDAEKALRIIRKVLADGMDPAEIIRTIRWHFMRLWSLKAMRETGMHSEEAGKKLKIPGFRMKEYLFQVEQMPHEVFRELFHQISETERLLKSRSGMRAIILDRMASEIITRLRHGSYTSA
jgi:DNA polymerase-3 subunit delta